MDKFSFTIQKEFCAECSLALRRFIGGMEGVESIDAESGELRIDFDSSKISAEDLARITRENIEKLGYKILD